MGYEIIFSFHKKNEDGKYDTETKDSFVKTIGRKTDEIPLEQVAAVVLGQLARRDIWITDTEIFEFAKRAITFKETDNGVIIKNRKFAYNQIAGELVSQEQVEPQPQQQLVIQQSPKPPAPKHDPNVPKRYECFRPSRDDFMNLQREGIKLTMGKPYPIFEEKVRNTSMGQILYYVTKNDELEAIEVSSLFFEPIRKPLVGISNNEDPYSNQGNLTYSGGSMDMPNLRR